MRTASAFLRTTIASDANALDLFTYDLPGTRGTLTPLVVAAGRYLKAAENQSNWKNVAATLDHLIPQNDPFTKNVAAPRKEPRSFFTHVNSRLSRANWSSRGVPLPSKSADSDSAPRASSGLADCRGFQFPGHLGAAYAGLAHLLHRTELELGTELPTH